MAKDPFKAWHALITGQSGSGKTTFACDWLRRKPADFRFVFDHQSKLARMLGKEPCYDLALFPAMALSGWVVFDPVKQFPGEFEEAFDAFCLSAFYASQKLPGYKLWFCDELGDFCTKTSSPKPVRMIITSGRNWGLHAMAVSRDISEIPKALRAQFTELVTFFQDDPGVIETLEERGFKGDEVRSLKPFEFLCRMPQQGLQYRGKGKL
jgi:hypothetical protein